MGRRCGLCVNVNTGTGYFALSTGITEKDHNYSEIVVQTHMHRFTACRFKYSGDKIHDEAV